MTGTGTDPLFVDTDLSVGGTFERVSENRQGPYDGSDLDQCFVLTNGP